MTVLKRDGREVEFDVRRIVMAIEKAMSETDKGVDHSLAKYIAEKIERELLIRQGEDNSIEAFDIELIQDMVEANLMSSDRQEVAKKYILYRAERTKQREASSGFMKEALEKIQGKNAQNSNANVDEESFGGRKAEASSALQKRLALERMPSDVAEAHRSGLIYQHDMDSYNIGMHNCFERNTAFITAHGIKTFEDFEPGDEVEVLTDLGRFKKARVICFTNQPTNILTFARGKNSKTVVATPNHRWMLRDGSFTENIQIGDRLTQAPNIYESFDWNKATPDEKKCWCYGFILGDGTRIHQKSKVTGEHYLSSSCRVRLCGDKVKYLSRFEECGFTRSSQYFGNGDVIIYASGYDKHIPDVNDYTATEIAAWVHGLYDADGNQTARTKAGKKMYGIQFSSQELCGFVESAFETAGLYISSRRNLTGRETNYGVRDYTVSYGFTPEQTHFDWKLVNIEPGEVMDVWCLDVEDDHTFVMQGGMVTGNCLFIDFQKLFRNGFSTRNGDVRPPSSFSTACQLVAVIFQIQSQCQYGGVGAVHLDYDLAPFVAKSFAKYMKDGCKYIAGWSDEQIDDASPYMKLEDEERWTSDTDRRIFAYALEMLNREGKQAAQGLYHNLNTLESRAGSQVPFTSINLGRDISPEGRLVTRWLLEASIEGIGKHHVTSIFPISIFSLKKGVNMDPGDPNYDLKQLAIRSMSCRIYPNFAMGDFPEAHEDPGDIDTIYATMGCRTMIGPDRHGMGYKRVGRGNNNPITIILPKLGIEYGIALKKRETADIEGFWTALDDTLSLVERAHLARWNILKSQSPKAAPFMYDNGSVADADKCTDNVEPALIHNTLAIGYLGVAEMCQALFGKDHVKDAEVHAFALKVVERINRFCKEAGERNNLNFSCYATPAESLCYTALKNLRAQYGVIPNVTDREWLTNSHHTPVWEKVSIFDKLRIEAPFCRYATGGCITYVECESTFMKNQKAIEDIIDYASNLGIPYLAFNFPIDTCMDCGYQGEFDAECPECGSSNIVSLRRVTGYLSADYRRFNAGKRAEVEARVKHTAYTQYGDS